MILARITPDGAAGMESVVRELAAGLADDTHPEAGCGARRFLRVIDVAFAAGYRYAGLQQQGRVGPYFPADVHSVIRETPGGAEVFSYLAYVTGPGGRERASDGPHEE